MRKPSVAPRLSVLSSCCTKLQSMLCHSAQLTRYFLTCRFAIYDRPDTFDANEARLKTHCRSIRRL